VEGRDQLRSTVVKDLSTELRNSFLGSKKGPRRERPESDNHTRLDSVNLSKEKWLTSLNFVESRIAILWGTAFDDVRNIDILSA
jgi:hypothetical protein